MKKNNHLFFGFCLYILNLKLYLHPPKRHGALAQLVEQWTENPCVPGSIPGGTTREDNFNLFENCPLFLLSKPLSICKISLKTSLTLSVRHLSSSKNRFSGNIELNNFCFWPIEDIS